MMKRRLLIIGIVTAVFFSVPITVTADTYKEFSTERLSEFLESDVAEQMDELYGDEGTDNTVFDVVLGAIRKELANFTAPVNALKFMILIAVATCFLAVYDTDERIIQLGAALCAASLMIPGITGLIDALARVCNAVSVFLSGAIPIYAGLMIASGNPTAGASYGTVTLFLSNLISVLANHVLIPALSILLGLGVSGIFSPLKTSGVIESVYKPVKWLLTFSVSAFSGIISLQTFISSKTDAAGIKTTKYLVSSAVPVVGSALGDGVEAVRQSLSLLRTGAGAFEFRAGSRGA